MDEDHPTWTAFKGTLPEETAATTLIISAATLTVSWNWINFWIFAYTERPQRTTWNSRVKKKGREKNKEIISVNVEQHKLKLRQDFT